MNPAVHGPFAFERKNLVGLAGNRLGHQARAEAAGTHADGAHFAIGKLVADILQVGVEAAVILMLEWLTWCPGWGCLPQMSHCLDMTISSIYSGCCPKRKIFGYAAALHHARA